MNVEFRSLITAKNWIEFNKIYFNFINKEKRKFVFGGLIIMGVISLSLIYRLVKTSSTADDYRELVLLFLIYGVITLLLTYKIMFSLNKKIIRAMKHPDNAKMFEAKEYIFTDSVIRVISKESWSEFTWDNVVRIVETQQFIGIFLNATGCFLFDKSSISKEQILNLEEIIHNKDGKKLMTIRK